MALSSNNIIALYTTATSTGKNKTFGNTSKDRKGEGYLPKGCLEMRVITQKPTPSATVISINSISVKTDEFWANVILNPFNIAASIGSSTTNLTKAATTIPISQVKIKFMLGAFYHKQLRMSRTLDQSGRHIDQRLAPGIRISVNLATSSRPTKLLMKPLNLSQGVNNREIRGSQFMRRYITRLRSSRPRFSTVVSMSSGYSLGWFSHFISVVY